MALTRTIARTTMTLARSLMCGTRRGVQLAAEAERASPPHPSGAALEAASRLRQTGLLEDSETPTAPGTSATSCPPAWSLFYSFDL